MKVVVTREGLSVPYCIAQVKVLQDDKLLAALKLYANPQIVFQGKPALLFGDLQLSTDDPEVVKALFSEAERQASSMGKNVLLGPMNGSTWQSYRLPLDSEQPLFTGDLSAPDVWAKALLAVGFSKADTYHSSIAALTIAEPPARPAGISILPIAPESISRDLPLLFSLCMNAFARAPYFSPLDEAAFVGQYSHAGPALAAGLSYIARMDDKVVAFVFAYSDPASDAVVIKTLARDPDFPLQGLTQAMIDIVCYTASRLGLGSAIHAFMHDGNRSVQLSAKYGGKLLRRYALFAKTVGE